MRWSYLLRAAKPVVAVESSTPTRVLIAGCKEHLASDVCNVVAQESEYDVVGTVTDEHSLASDSGRLQPDVVLIDTQLLKQCSSQVILTIRRQSPMTKVVAWGNSVTDTAAVARFGIDGFIPVDVMGQPPTNPVRDPESTTKKTSPQSSESFEPPPKTPEDEQTALYLRKCLYGISHGKTVATDQSTLLIVILGITFTFCALFILFVLLSVR